MNVDSLLDNVAYGADEVARVGAIRALAEEGDPGDARTLNVLRHASQDASPVVAFQARRALDRLATRGRTGASGRAATASPELSGPTLERFQTYLTHPDDREIRIRAIDLAIDRNARATLPLLIAQLDAETDVFVIAKLAKAVGLLGDVSVLPRLAPFLKHSDSRVRANTVEGLAAIQAEPVFMLLVGMLEDADNRVRANAVRALKGYQQFDPVQALGGMVRSANPGDRASALYVLSRMSTPRAVETLLPLITDPDEQIQSSAWDAVREKGFLLGEKLLDHLEELARNRPDLAAPIGVCLDGLETRASEDLLPRAQALRERIAAGGAAALATPAPTGPLVPEMAPPAPLPARAAPALVPGSGVHGRPRIGSRAGSRPASGASRVATDPDGDMPAGGAGALVETEFDALGEAELAAKLDALEAGDPVAALAALERAAHSRARPVRLEAKRRITRIRRAAEGKQREAARSRELKRGAAIAAAGVALLVVLLLGLGPAMKSMFARPRPPGPSPVASSGAGSGPEVRPSPGNGGPPAGASGGGPVPSPGPSSVAAVGPPSPSPAASPNLPPSPLASVPPPSGPPPGPPEAGRAVGPPGRYVSLCMSPGGDRLALTREEIRPAPPGSPPGARVAARDLVAIDLRSGKPTVVTSDGQSQDPCFFSSGLAWIRGAYGVGDLMLSDGAGTRALTDRLAASEPVESPDHASGAMQVNVVDDQGKLLGSDIVLVDFTAGIRSNLKGLMDGVGGRYLTTTAHARHPQFSPDGKSVAYVSVPPAPAWSEVHVLDLASGKEAVRSLGADVLQFVWHARSGRILCLTRAGDGTRLVSLDPARSDAGAVLLHRKGPDSLTGFAVDEAGSRLIVVVSKVPPSAAGPGVAGDLWLAEPSGTLVRALTHDGANRNTVLLKDGHMVAYVKSVAQRDTAWIQELAAGPGPGPGAGGGGVPVAGASAAPSPRNGAAPPAPGGK